MATRDQIQRRIEVLQGQVDSGSVNPIQAELELGQLRGQLKQLDQADFSRTPAGRRRPWFIGAALLIVVGLGMLAWWNSQANSAYEAGIRTGSGFFDIEAVQCNADGSVDIDALVPVVQEFGDGVVPAAVDTCSFTRDERDEFAEGLAPLIIGAFVLAALAPLRAATIRPD